MKMTMMKAVLAFAFISIVLSACDKKQKEQTVQTELVKTEEVVKDTTTYGVCAESGMSTFGLISGADTLLLSRTSDAGDYAVLSGSVVEGDSFAVTMTDDRQSLVTAINLTQLQRFFKQGDFRIINGGLELKNDDGDFEPVQIGELDKQKFTATYPDGQAKQWQPLK